MGQSSTLGAMSVRQAAVNQLAVPQLPASLDPATKKALTDWTAQLQLAIGRAFNALRLDQSNAVAGAVGVGFPGSQWTMTAADYLVHGYYDLNHDLDTYNIIGSIYRTHTSNGAADPLQPDAPFRFQRPVSLGPNWIRVILATAPVAGEVFAIALFASPGH